MEPASNLYNHMRLLKLQGCQKLFSCAQWKLVEQEEEAGTRFHQGRTSNQITVPNKRGRAATINILRRLIWNKVRQPYSFSNGNKPFLPTTARKEHSLCHALSSKVFSVHLDINPVCNVISKDYLLPPTQRTTWQTYLGAILKITLRILYA